MLRHAKVFAQMTRAMARSSCLLRRIDVAPADQLDPATDVSTWLVECYRRCGKGRPRAAGLANTRFGRSTPPGIVPSPPDRSAQRDQDRIAASLPHLRHYPPGPGVQYTPDGLFLAEQNQRAQLVDGLSPLRSRTGEQITDHFSLVHLSSPPAAGHLALAVGPSHGWLPARDRE